MGTRSWDHQPVIADPAVSTMHRVLLERLVDELGDLDRLVWTSEQLDRKDLRDRVSEAMAHACALLDLVAPVPAGEIESGP